MFNPRLTRKQLVQRGAGGVALLSVPGLLAACGGGGGGGTAAGGEVADVLNFANWPFYIDTTKPTTFDQFTEQTGIEVKYFEEIADNAQYFAKIRGPLSQGESIDRDIFVFTDNSRFPALFIEQGWVQKLDKSLIPNISNLIPAQQHPPFDPNREYSLPWLGGITGIAWNTRLTEPVRTMKQFFTAPQLHGKTTMLKELADSVGLTMLGNGDDPGKVTPETFDEAIATVTSAVESGQIQSFLGNEYAVPLAKGELAASIAWSGDVISLLADNPHLRWDIPESGGMIWTDNMLIPTGGSVPTASTYMNSVYDPEVAARIAVEVTYIPMVAGAQEAAAQIDPKAAENSLIFPTEEVLSNVHQYDSAALNNPEQIAAWQKVLGQ